MAQSKLIDDLKHPSAYPEITKKVKFVQTHISTVFIGDDFVYKIKKPVNFGFLDFSTLEKRNFYCNKEVELNNRFSQGVYLGVLPVTYDGIKHSINGKGKVVDYAVIMRRLKDEDLMKSRFKQGKITSQEIARIGKAIAAFHKISGQSKEIDNFGRIDAIKFNTDENFQQTVEFIGNSISKKQYNDLKKWTEEFFKKNQQIFAERIKNGKIRDCHGDLHMEHICLTDPIIIFDCIEFNDRFRYVDTLSDISFLLMDLEFNGGKRLSEQLYESYLNNSSEKDEKITYLLTNFYKLYRAYVRGKVTSLILKDTAVPDNEKIKARDIAQRYFTLAHSYISE